MASNNDNLLKQLVEAENSHNIEKLPALLTEDIVFEDLSFGVLTEGKDAFIQSYAGFIAAVPDFKIEPKSWLTDDRSFAVELVFTGTQKGDLPGLPATGKSFSIRGCSFGEFENGKVKGRRDYWDSASFTKQLVGEQK